MKLPGFLSFFTVALASRELGHFGALALPMNAVLTDNELVEEAPPPKRLLCSQCGQRGAVFMIGNEPVCIPCEHTFQQSQWMKFAQNAAMLNMLDQEMVSIVGMPHLSNQIEIPRAPVPPLYYNNHSVTVNGGTVGAINMGTANDIQVSLEAITQNGDLGVADKLADLTNAVLNAEEADAATKNELLDQIAFITQQASTKPGERKPGTIKAMVSAVQEGAGAITSAAGAWQAVEPLLKGHFGL